MDKFTRLTGVAAPLNMVNVDTDMIIPKQYLKTIKRTGLKDGLFSEMRWDENGKSKDFMLDQAPYREAKILVAGDNFGCGSSREHAPWALLDFGIRAVVSTQIASIFRANALKNGLLPVVVDAEFHRRLVDEPGREVTIDLEAKTIATSSGASASFPIDPFDRHCLLQGIDHLAFLLEQEHAIAAYESRAASRG